jgi:hypothetical protein
MRPAEDAPSSACGHIAINGPFAFGPRVVVKLSAIAWTVAWQVNPEIPFQSVVAMVGGLMSLALNVADGITMVGLDDGALLSLADK